VKKIPASSAAAAIVGAELKGMCDGGRLEDLMVVGPAKGCVPVPVTCAAVQPVEVAETASEVVTALVPVTETFEMV